LKERKGKITRKTNESAKNKTKKVMHKRKENKKRKKKKKSKMRKKNIYLCTRGRCLKG
jgi:hypothetical protein